MIGQLLAGLGVVAGGAALGIRANHRMPVPTDVAAQIRAALSSGNIPTMEAVAKAYATTKWKPQCGIVLSAMRAATTASKEPADVKAMYNATLVSATPATMRTLAKSYAAKYPVLAGHLNDVAKILGG